MPPPAGGHVLEHLPLQLLVLRAEPLELAAIVAAAAGAAAPALFCDYGREGIQRGYVICGALKNNPDQILSDLK